MLAMAMEFWARLADVVYLRKLPVPVVVLVLKVQVEALGVVTTALAVQLILGFVPAAANAECLGP